MDRFFSDSAQWSGNVRRRILFLKSYLFAFIIRNKNCLFIRDLVWYLLSFIAGCFSTVVIEVIFMLSLTVSEPIYKCQSQSHFATDGQSVSMSWCRAQVWNFWPEIFFFKFSVLSFLGRPLWREVGSVICQSCLYLHLYTNAIWSFIYI
jgi:hypothetical protein